MKKIIPMFVLVVFFTTCNQKTNDDFIEKLENGQISICEIKKT